MYQHSGFGGKNRHISRWQYSTVRRCTKCDICQRASIFAAGRSNDFSERYIAPNLLNRGSTGSWTQARLEGPILWGFLVGLFICFRHYWYLKYKKYNK